jgi:hypothetical protein
MSEQLYSFEVAIGDGRKLSYSTHASSEAEARERAKQFAKRMKQRRMQTPIGHEPDGVYLAR